MALIAVAAFVVVQRIANEAPAADDAVFEVESDVESPRRSEIRRTTELVLHLESGTCFPGDKEEIARQINAPVRVEIQDRREAVVIKARIDHDYVKSFSPRLREGESCGGVGIIFTRRVRLPTPIGKRALLNGGFIHRGLIPRVLVRLSRMLL